MKIVEMTGEHLDGVCEIENVCFSHPWSRQSIENELKNENSVFLCALDGEKVIGYIGMSTVLDEGYIYNVAVAENYRKRGAGTALVNALVTFGKKNNFAFITLEVRQSNEKALSLYRKLGFVKAGERKNYYSAPVENAILMTYYF